MKIIYLIFFMLILSCSTVKKVYICGDHQCIDKKEFNEYFSKNLIIEIKSQEKKKKKNIDLVKLNTVSSAKEKKKEYINSKKEQKIKAVKEKKRLKIERVRLKEERKIRKIEEKIKAKKASIISKLPKSTVYTDETINNKKNNNRDNTKNVFDKKQYQEKKDLVKVPNKNTSFKSVSSNNVLSICGEIKDCDIDKITELLIKKGKDKPFPNITLN